MGVNKMQGVSAYLEYIGPQGRKRRTSCVYNKGMKCCCKISPYYMLKCGGRFICMHFNDTALAKKSIKKR